MNTENSSTIKVILRSRPTQNFATKNIVLDSMENVIILIYRFKINLIFNIH
jgi:hypothetical protein